MCGITGIVLADPQARVEQEVLDRMTDVLAHRGPDGRGTKSWGHVAFGHRRLSIIDLDTGDQPMASADGLAWITYNGELYNYVELRAELEKRGFAFKTQSDTEVVLHLYQAFGTAMFERMNGMFAFALYDLEHGEVLLARDRFGEKPLYYYKDADRFLFGSEIKALLQAGLERRPDPTALQEYLLFQHCLDDRTLFAGVRKVRPSTYLRVSDRGAVLEEREYWALDFHEDHSVPEATYHGQVRALLEDSVRLRLRSDVPVGTYLSGGLDSSVVAGIARQHAGAGLPAFTGHFAEPGFSERSYAEAVARLNGSTHHLVQPRAEDFAANLRRMLWHMDEPAAGPGLFPQLLVSELASEHVKVVLGGQGGDEVFGGYARYLMLYLEECLKGSIFGTQDPKRHIVTWNSILPNLAMLQQYVPLLQRFWSRGLFEPMEQRYFTLITRIQDPARYFAPGFLSGLDRDAAFRAFERQFNAPSRATGGSALFNRMTAYDLKTSLEALLQVEDRMSMAVGLESRLPLLDHRLVELLFKMPPLYKWRDGRSKAALVAAAGDLLPEQVLERKDKMGFPVPLDAWARGPLRGFFRDILLGEAARKRGIYDEPALAALIDGEQPFGRELWGLLCLEVWFQTFIDPAEAPRAAPGGAQQGQKVAEVVA